MACCESKEEKAQQDALAAVQFDEILYREPAVLLSVKYGVDENIIFSLLKEENNPNYFPNEEFEDRLFGKNARTRIETYSQKYSLPQQTVASILIDYKAMHSND